MNKRELIGTYYVKVCMFDGFDVLIEAMPDWDIQWLIENYNLVPDTENIGDYLIRLSKAGLRRIHNHFEQNIDCGGIKEMLRYIRKHRSISVSIWVDISTDANKKPYPNLFAGNGHNKRLV